MPRPQCCSPDVPNNGGWGIFQAILGWTNSATYGSVIAYNVYWIFVMTTFIIMRFRETRGRWPFMKAKPESRSYEDEAPSGSDSHEGPTAEPKGTNSRARPVYV